MPKTNGDNSIASIKEKIESAKAALDPPVPDSGAVGQAHLAWRMVIDLVAGVGLGAAIGYGLDALFGTLPILMAVFTLLGLAAGVNLMLRTAKEVGRGTADGNGKESNSGN